jgi:hypothetical protein
VRHRQPQSGEDRELSVADLLREREGPLTGLHCPVVSAHEVEWKDGPRQHVREPGAVADPLGEELGFVQMPEERFVLRQCRQRISQVTTEEIDAKGGVLARLR